MNSDCSIILLCLFISFGIFRYFVLLMREFPGPFEKLYPKKRSASKARGISQSDYHIHHGTGKEIDVEIDLRLHPHRGKEIVAILLNQKMKNVLIM